MIIPILQHIAVYSCADVRVHVWTINAAQWDMSRHRLCPTTTSSI